MRVWLIALLTLLIQGVFSLIGFVVGLACAGLYLGYTRAWEITMPRQAPLEDEDGDE